MSDQLTAILQRDIESSLGDIEMRTRLVRALDEYHSTIRAAREQLRAAALAAFGLEEQARRPPTLEELERAVRSWQAH